MRTVVTALLILIGASAFDAARADPYPWCAVYGGRNGGSTFCYLRTLEQCRAQVSGVGGFCAPNQFYDGRPVVTPGDGPSPGRRRKAAS